MLDFSDIIKACYVTFTSWRLRTPRFIFEAFQRHCSVKCKTVVTYEEHFAVHTELAPNPFSMLRNLGSVTFF